MAKKEHVLVVEDEEHLATGIKYNLDAEGYRVTIVGDGPSALAALEENAGDIDLVILDLMLPSMSGYRVCETLRDRDKNLPVLILSARTLAEDRARGFDVGANQYLTKPFDLDEFLSRVRNLLAMHRSGNRQPDDAPGECAVLEFAGARVNFETFEVTVAGQPVLLRYFAENEGRVIPRHELLENVWGLSGKLQTRAPDQFLRRLRKTFEPNPAEPKHFVTIRDAGYRFVAEPGESS